MARVKYTFKDVKNIVEDNNYELLSLEEEIVNDKGFVLTSTKIKVWCKNSKHKPYEVEFNKFKGYGKQRPTRCRQCLTDIQRLNYEEVKKYIETFSYKLLSTEYKNNREKMSLLCPEGHEFKMSYTKFQSGHRCSICNGGIKYDYTYIKEYIEKEDYKILSTEYRNAHDKLKIECPHGHHIEMTFNDFQQNKRCSICCGNKKYDYNYVKKYIDDEGYKLLSTEYKNNVDKISLKCSEGHEFKMSFSCFKNRNQRCPICKESKGEKRIEKWLLENNILNISQYKFDDCKFKRELPFDFYLPQYNICIEYDGELHYVIKEHFGGLDKFIDTKIRDTIKTEYCKKNNINLIRIPYWEFDKIEEILKRILNHK